MSTGGFALVCKEQFDDYMEEGYGQKDLWEDDYKLLNWVAGEAGSSCVDGS